MDILYLASGLLVYVITIAVISMMLGQNRINPDRRKVDRRRNREDRRQVARPGSGGCRRMEERRLIHSGIPT